MSDYISRESVLNTIEDMDKALDTDRTVEEYKALLIECIKALPSRDSITELQNQKTGHWIKLNCKDCKYWESDVMTMVDGIPLIVAHSICNKWSGCKTEPNGYCFLAEPKGEE